MRIVDKLYGQQKRLQTLHGEPQELKVILEDAECDFETDYYGYPVCRAALKSEVFVPFGYQQKYRCPYCRLANQPAYGYKNKSAFRQHTQDCRFNPRRKK